MKTERASRKGKQRVLSGLGVSPGIAIGPAYVIDPDALSVPDYRVVPAAVDDELERFAAAVELSRTQVGKLKRKAKNLPAAARSEVALLLDAYRQMLTDSRLIRGVNGRIADQRYNAEAAVHAEGEAIAGTFEAIDEPYLAARGQEIREIANRLIRNLTETPFEAYASAPANAVIIAEELTPADTALINPARIGGFATVLGGAEGHTAIMARALGLPAVLGIAGLVGDAAAGGVPAGATVIVDGDAGQVIVDPTAATLADYRRRRAALVREARRLGRLTRLPAVTRDGVAIKIEANVELPCEAQSAATAGAESIGLLRSEFLYMNRADLPGEDEQVEAIREIIDHMSGRPVTVRTLDVGGEKLASSLSDELGESANPALGLRAIRLSLEVPRLLETQLAAILRAGAFGDVRILLPMIATPGEVVQVRKILARVTRRLTRRGVKIAERTPPVGVMIEVPGAALAADALAQVADFFAIGTNDLTMYALAIDRGEERVAHLYNPLHPAVLRLIQFATTSALRARRPVSLCGEIAGDPRFAPLILGLGVRELSMAPPSIPRVKERVRALELGEATRRAALIMDQSDSGRIAALLDDFNEVW